MITSNKIFDVNWTCLINCIKIETRSIFFRHFELFLTIKQHIHTVPDHLSINSVGFNKWSCIQYPINDSITSIWLFNLDFQIWCWWYNSFYPGCPNTLYRNYYCNSWLHFREYIPITNIIGSEKKIIYCVHVWQIDLYAALV